MQPSNKKVLAISGSTRAESSNLRLLRTLANMTADQLEWSFYGSIADLPHFNPDRDNAEPPAEVVEFRRQIRAADGVVICTPEYAHGVPGALKNALDWTVSSADFSGRPTVLITASTDGRMGHQALLETLRVIEAKEVDNLQLLISFVRAKLDAHGGIRDEDTLKAVEHIMNAFMQALNTSDSVPEL